MRQPLEMDWDNVTELWENQGHPLTVGRLLRAMEEALERGDYSDTPILVELYEGTSARVRLVAQEMGFTGQGRAPDAVVLTGHSRRGRPGSDSVGLPPSADQSISRL